SMLESGLLRLAWFAILNTSALKTRTACSPSGNERAKDASKLNRPGPRNAFRAVFPSSPAGGCTKASRFNSFWPDPVTSYVYGFAVALARLARLFNSGSTEFTRTEYGKPERIALTAETLQLLPTRAKSDRELSRGPLHRPNTARL